MDLTATQQFTATQLLDLKRPDQAARRSWQQSLAEYLPFAYIAAGFTAFFATLYVPEWFWVLPYYFLMACGGVHAILFLANSAGKDTQTTLADKE